jgi:hypothetical protein
MVLGGAFVLRRVFAHSTLHWPLKKVRYADLEYYGFEDHFQMILSLIQLEHDLLCHNKLKMNSANAFRAPPLEALCCVM